RPEAQEPQNAPGCAPAIPSGCDLNGDGDADDEVLHVYHQATGQTDNLGLASIALEDVRVQFYDGDPAAGGTPIGGAVTPRKYWGSGDVLMAMADVDWTAVEGAHTIVA